MHVLDRFRVISKNTKVVYGVAVDGIAVDFFVIIEDAVSPKRPSAHDMSVC